MDYDKQLKVTDYHREASHAFIVRDIKDTFNVIINVGIVWNERLGVHVLQVPNEKAYNEIMSAQQYTDSLQQTFV
jgi:hypothetical protein